MLHYIILNFTVHAALHVTLHYAILHYIALLTLAYALRDMKLITLDFTLHFAAYVQLYMLSYIAFYELHFNLYILQLT